jgi:hypothetical protein
VNMRSTEPARIIGSTTTILAAIYVIVNQIWPGLLSDDLQSAISETTLIWVPLIVAALIRRKVFAPASVGKLERELIDLKKDYKNLVADYNAVTRPPTPKFEV